jgi:hypothetical protein
MIPEILEIVRGLARRGNSGPPPQTPPSRGIFAKRPQAESTFDTPVEEGPIPVGEESIIQKVEERERQE